MEKLNLETQENENRFDPKTMEMLTKSLKTIIEHREEEKDVFPEEYYNEVEDTLKNLEKPENP